MPREPRHKLLIWTLLTGVLLTVTAVPGDCNSRRAKFDEYQVKSVFLFNLAHFVFWPKESFSATGNSFVITLLGDTPIRENLEEISHNEKIGGHPIVIRRIDSISDLQPSQILFIHSDFKHSMSDLLKQTNRHGLLTVSDYPGFLASGGAVNLQIIRKWLALELNPSAAAGNGIEFSSKLLQLAKRIEGGSK